MFCPICGFTYAPWHPTDVCRHKQIHDNSVLGPVCHLRDADDPEEATDRRHTPKIFVCTGQRTWLWDSLWKAMREAGNRSCQDYFSGPEWLVDNTGLMVYRAPNPDPRAVSFVLYRPGKAGALVLWTWTAIGARRFGFCRKLIEQLADQYGKVYWQPPFSPSGQATASSLSPGGEVLIGKVLNDALPGFATGPDEPQA